MQAVNRAGSWASEFKAFILRGNVVDLAIAVIIGAAFGAVVTALAQDIIMPLIGAFGGKVTFDQYYWTINKSEIKIGSFVTAVVSFLIIAAVIFFFVLKPINALMARRKSEPPPDPTTRDCPYCLSTIPIKASRCAFCTQEVPVLAGVEAHVEA
ncbi:MAG TPA: large conductance mechanosensitive channel protein MscL [Ktedonobacterales bacterium]|jgi:large conductance mechanosensitive channel|nr:large conductance mechanosensitive channel protein MscL [Ktedonobacterales bacterium]